MSGGKPFRRPELKARLKRCVNERLSVSGCRRLYDSKQRDLLLGERNGLREQMSGCGKTGRSSCPAGSAALSQRPSNSFQCRVPYEWPLPGKAIGSRTVGDEGECRPAASLSCGQGYKVSAYGKAFPCRRALQVSADPFYGGLAPVTPPMRTPLPRRRVLYLSLSGGSGRRARVEPLGRPASPAVPDCSIALRPFRCRPALAAVPSVAVAAHPRLSGEACCRGG